MTMAAANDPIAAEAQAGLDLALPVAKIRGEPLAQLPTDLYIPPEALSVFLDTFEGPLDLLLYLIRRHSLDVLDIPMAELTRQYMEYVEMMRTQQLELAAEFVGDQLPDRGFVALAPVLRRPEREKRRRLGVEASQTQRTIHDSSFPTHGVSSQ